MQLQLPWMGLGVARVAAAESIREVIQMQIVDADLNFWLLAVRVGGGV